MPRPLWCAIRLPQWPLAVLPGDGERPRAVVLGQRLFRCCPRGQERGLAPGMKLATAHALVDDLLVQPRDTVLEQTALLRLAWQVQHFTPGISLHAPGPAEDETSDAGLLLDIGGSLKLFGGSEPLLVALHTLLTGLGHVWHTGVGHTPLAAWQLSHAPARDGLQALQTAGESDDPQAPFRAALAHQPVTRLALSAPLREALAAPGLRTLGDVLALPRAALGKRFGTPFLLWCERLLGERPDPRPSLTPPERFRLTREFSEPVRDSQYLLPVMQQQLAALGAWLQRRQQAVRAIRWHLTDHQGPQPGLTLRRAYPATDTTLWLTLTERRLAEHRLRAPVLSLTLLCSRPQAASDAGASLLPAPGGRTPAHLLLEKLASLPRLRLSSLTGADGHLPENSQRSIDPLHPAGTPPDNGPSTRALWQRQPLWLLPTPEAVTRNARGQLHWRGAPLTLLLPDRRLLPPWWAHQEDTREDRQQRDYHLARHGRSGTLCWVYRTRERGWFVQGFF